MMDIEIISEKIREEKDNLVAKAFTCQITSLLLINGIVPIMTEYKKEDLDSITDKDRYKLVYELGVTFDKLDTSEHDKQVRTEAIDECIQAIEDEYYDAGFGDYHEAEMIVRMLEKLKEENYESN